MTSILVGLMCLTTGVYLVAGWQALWISAPLRIEGVILGLMHSIRVGRLYAADALASPPYSILTHTPLSYYLGYGFSLLAPNQYWPLRTLTILATIAMGATFYLYQRKEGLSPLEALISPAFFVALEPMFLWCFMSRCPDQFEVMFSMGAFMIFKKQLRSQKWAKSESIAIGILAALAISSKQTAALTLPMTLGICRLLRREYRGLAIEILSAACLLAIGFAYFEIHSGHGFHRNLFGYAEQPPLRFLFNPVVIDEMGLTLLLAALVLATLPVKDSLARTYFLVSLAIGLFSATRLGASASHFFDACAALSLMVGGAVHQMRRQRGKIPLRWVLGAAGIVAILLVFLVRDASWRNKVDTGDYASAVHALQRTEGPIFAPDAGMLLHAGHHDIWGDDAFVLDHALAHDEAFLDLFRKGYFKACILDKLFPGIVFYPPPISDVISENYSCLWKNRRYVLLVYRPRPASKSVKEVVR